MIEKALSGDRKYWTWVITLLLLMGAGGYCYWLQLNEGLGITGLSRSGDSDQLPVAGDLRRGSRRVRRRDHRR